MGKKLLLTAICLLVLPIFYSSSFDPGQKKDAAPFQSIAVAGHVLVGGWWCECGGQDCICDPGEQPGTRTTKAVTDRSLSHGPASSPEGRMPDFGSAALMLVLALFVWSRARA